jgi:hypothetical protein
MTRAKRARAARASESSLDKKTILETWQSYTPQQIVAMFRAEYPNVRTLSVTLSRFRIQLSSSENPPPDKYLEDMKLQTEEYRAIRKAANDQLTRGSLNVAVIGNSDHIVSQALLYMRSDDPYLCYCGLLICSGLRPIEILKVAEFSTELNNPPVEKDLQAWFACQSLVGNVKSGYNPGRYRCFLCPYWMIERALAIVRMRWPVQHMDNEQISSRYNKSLGAVLQNAYQQWPGINAKLCRRFFAVYAYEYFGKSPITGGSMSSLIGFSHWMLGHVSLNDGAISYQSLVLHPKPMLKLLEHPATTISTLLAREQKEALRPLKL